MTRERGRGALAGGNLRRRLRGGGSRTAWACSLLLAASVLPAGAVDALLTDDTTVLEPPSRPVASGKAPTLAVRQGRSHALVRFDLGTLPEQAAGTEVIKATLKLWIGAVAREGSIEVVRVEGDWRESDPRGGAGASLGTPVARAVVVEQRDEKSFLVVDVTSAVRDWLDGISENRGLAIVGAGGGVSVVLDSKENTEGGHEPELQVVLDWRAGAWPASHSILGEPGPPGPQGPPGPAGGAGPPGTSLNPLRVAERRLYIALGTGFTAGTGPGPSGIVFDGSSLWVASRDGNSLSRHRLVDGATIGSVAVGAGPSALAFDGYHVWVANSADGTVTRVRASDASIQGTFAVGANPTALAFDGSSVWVVNSGSSSLTRLRASDGALQGTFAVGAGPAGICHDGADLWVTNSLDGTIMRVAGSDGQILSTWPAGSAPRGVAFDGRDLWVASSGSGTVIRISRADGSQTGSFPVGTGPGAVAFDGEAIWVANTGNASVSVLRSSDGATLATPEVGDSPEGIAFDGAHLWVTCHLSDTISKL